MDKRVNPKDGKKRPDQIPPPIITLTKEKRDSSASDISQASSVSSVNTIYVSPGTSSYPIQPEPPNPRSKILVSSGCYLIKDKYMSTVRKCESSKFITLNNGECIPFLGLGTNNLVGKKCVQVVKEGIDLGYRLIDCSYVDRNEVEIGIALKQKMDDKSVTRSDLFIVDKLWNTFHRPDLIVEACRKSLRNLKLEFIDLYLMHWPIAFVPGKELFPMEGDGKYKTENIPIEDVYKGMEECVNLKLCKGIGLANFNSEQLKRILDIATVKPAVNMVECHVYHNEANLLNFCRSHSVDVLAFQPLAAPTMMVNRTIPNPITDKVLVDISRKNKVSVPQVMLRFLLHLGVIPVHTASNFSRFGEYLSIFDFALSDAEMSRIKTLDMQNGRTEIFAKAKHDINYPFSFVY